MIHSALGKIHRGVGKILLKAEKNLLTDAFPGEKQEGERKIIPFFH